MLPVYHPGLCHHGIRAGPAEWMTVAGGLYAWIILLKLTRSTGENCHTTFSSDLDNPSKSELWRVRPQRLAGSWTQWRYTIQGWKVKTQKVRLHGLTRKWGSTSSWMPAFVGTTDADDVILIIINITYYIAGIIIRTTSPRTLRGNTAMARYVPSITLPFSKRRNAAVAKVIVLVAVLVFCAWVRRG